MKRLFTILGMILLINSSSVGQADTIKLNGPSFEQEPHIGNHNNMNVKYWFDCGVINFPHSTPPDIHPSDFWGVTKTAFEGKTYLGLVVRDDDSYESISQKLTVELLAGETYIFSLYLAQSKKYLSPSKLESRNSDFSKVNYTKPAVFRLWGGYGYCDDRELLAVSEPIDHEDWKKYSFTIKPTTNISSITIEAFYKMPVIMPYNGHILVDNLSDIIKLKNEDIKPNVITEEKIPPHLRMKSKNKED